MGFHSGSGGPERTATLEQWGEGIVADVNGVIYSAEVGPRGVKRYHRYIDP